LHWVDTVEGSADLAVARAEHAVALSGSDGSLAHLEETHGELVALGDQGADHQAHPALARFAGAVEAIASDLADGDTDGATQLVGTSLQEAHNELTSALTGARATLQSSVDSGTGIAAGWIEFALVLAIPLCVAGAFYILSRRWVAAVESRSGRQIAEERESTRVKGAVAAGLSHALRTPLTSIYGFAQILSRGEISGVEAIRETAQMIADEAAETKRIVDDVLMASSLDGASVDFDPAPIRIGDVIERAVAPFESCGVAVRREPTAAMATADATLLEQVVTNLLANAVRHGGPDIGLDVTIGDDTIDIEVADNGPGLGDEEEGPILDRMTNESALLGAGCGLGLPVASGLSRLMGGSLRYQRYSGRSYFVVTLPAAGSGDAGEEVSVAEMIKSLLV
jgi:signal transduction histidine kinase